MAFIHSPKVVTDGLVLALDAGNPKSYISGSTAWNNLVNPNISGSLTNGPTYSSANLGSIVFDGVDDYVNNIGSISDFSFIQNTGVFTISAWVRLTDLSVARYFLGNNNGTTSAKGFYLGYSGDSGTLVLLITYGVGGQSTLLNFQNNIFTVNDWTQVTCVGDGITFQVYKNGIRFGSSAAFGVFSTGNSARTLSIGRINNLNSSYWQGNVSQTSIYNRALSATEVQQNFNALRGRYGL